jgi:hypothetical protein
MVGSPGDGGHYSLRSAPIAACQYDGAQGANPSLSGATMNYEIGKMKLDELASYFRDGKLAP